MTEIVSASADTSERMCLPVKKIISSFLALCCLTVATIFGVSAQSLTPATGDRAVELLPLFIILMLIAIAAIVACLVIFKKKK